MGKIPCNINLGTFHRRALSSKYNYSLKGFICRAVLFFENNLISLVNIFKIILLSSVTVMQKLCILHAISFYDNDAVVIIKKKVELNATPNVGSISLKENARGGK